MLVGFVLAAALMGAMPIDAPAIAAVATTAIDLALKVLPSFRSSRRAMIADVNRFKV